MLWTEEEEQDQWENESPAESHSQFEQGIFLFVLYSLPLKETFVNLKLSERERESYNFLYPQTDKASMLDEAIEYLKQLQLQVQVSPL